MSKKLNYIYSTLAADVAYTVYDTSPADMPIPVGQITVKGGAGVADKRLITPNGVVTAVTEENLTRLRENEIFKLHEANGFIQVTTDKVDEDVAAADMTTRDISAPLVAGDFAPGKAPTVAGETPEIDAGAPPPPPRPPAPPSPRRA